ncbi:hypothetical protein GCM10011387_00780 [Pedobacter quisquiliarum]|jgi:hypothetical protein|uniref:Uncharacterized protein n=1 Tax=Pedobacter quisquiliarum TaxID=1834438 RepID=A0A916TXM3_9SPHI|nr:hypothetical protein [Pedobacter quisquiliarum]GGC51248.1 hypothetical protein GCM10011387_00780 [Pedobacter quisquiliarum]
MTEIFYKNNTGELHKLLMHNVNASEFISKLNNTSIEVLCAIEDGSIVCASPEFKAIEDNISMIFIDLVSQPNA